jgi:hypothetical protein
MNASTPIFFKAPRAATTEEIAAAGFRLDGDQAQSPHTLAWYPVSAFRVHASITDQAGERRFGRFLVIEDGEPAAERIQIDLAGLR